MTQTQTALGRARRALVALAASLVLGAAPTVAEAAPDPETGFGYNVQSLVRAGPGDVTVFTPAQWPGFLGQMATDGLRIARTDAVWARAEPARPQGAVHTYDWSGPDELAAAFARAGVRWDAVLTSSPAWARAGGNLWNAPTRDRYADYAAFAGAFAARYGAGGAFWAAHPELPQLPVLTFEVWNEPNTSVHWGSTPDAAAYAGLFRGAQAAIKAVAPTARVLVGGIVWNDDVAYINAFFGALGPGVPVDGLGSHPYAPTMLGLAANVLRVRTALDALGRADVPLEINELGWPAAYDRVPASNAIDGPVSDVARAGTMALAVDALSRSTCVTGSIQIYDLVESEADRTHVESLMGLYRRDGSRTRTGQAFAQAVARFRAAVADPGPPVPVCGARGAPATRLLGLDLAGAPAKGGCVVVTATYRGLPVEEVLAHAVAPFEATRPTDADGRALLCPPARTTRRTPWRFTADIPGVAGSNVVDCEKGRDCRAIGAAAACTQARLRITGSRRLAAVRSRGLRVSTAGCEPQLGGAVRVRTALKLSRAAARQAGLRSVAIGRGTARVDPGGSVVIPTKLTSAARRALASARRLTVTLEVSAREGASTTTSARTLVLRR